MKELLLTIDVVCSQGLSVKGGETEVVMVPFTGRAFGEHFSGRIIGPGVDTQKFGLKSGEGTLSARYMLQGTDSEGCPCRIFIENSIHDEAGWHPMLVTDSKVLAEWEHLPLTASVDGTESGVVVRIYSDKEEGK
ncbi:hypothetical protein SAMN02910317_00199 [Ruminococcaceae bacterium FB2012]|nr:hypothetical protein SAMN02910317_00199 [Ruminococcaceae bacterium FB2012]